jgi:hypothetical protein
MLCSSKNVFLYNLKTKLKKGLIFYYKTSGITCLKKDVDVDYSKKLRKFEEEVNLIMKGNLER